MRVINVSLTLDQADLLDKLLDEKLDQTKFFDFGDETRDPNAGADYFLLHFAIEQAREAEAKLRPSK